jgi:RHS repeat-associated protein
MRWIADVVQRYFNATMGRFWTPDPSGLAAVNPLNPQSWNMYAYANRDPVNFNDPSGNDGCAVETGFCYTPYPGFGTFQSDPIVAAGLGGDQPGPIWEVGIGTDAGGSYLTAFPIAPGLIAVNPAGSIPVRKRIGELEQNLDESCQDWLETSPLSPTAVQLVGFMDQERNGGAGIAQFVDYSGQPSGIVSAAKLDIAGMNILINSAGSYFAKNQAPSGTGNLNTGTPRYQIFVLLHEFAHQLGVPGFLPEGGILGVDTDIEKKNNQMILDHCGKTLAAFSNGMA